MRKLAVALLLLLCASWELAAESRATIIADKITHDRSSGDLSATGNVHVYYDGQLLQASRLTHSDGVLTAEGPLTLADGEILVVVADYAELDEGLRIGILRGFELLLDNQLNMTGSSLDAWGERYVLLRNVIATTCNTCEAGEVPVWHFRSRAVVHDKQEKQIYLQDAEFVIGELGLFTLPWVRLPDPTVERQSGVLFPTVNYSKSRGLTFGVPVYLTLGNHADVTLTPHYNSKSKHYLGFELRQRFRPGWLELYGSVARSRSGEGLRGHVGMEGGWDLGHGFNLFFSGEKPKDDDYLEEYGISSDEEFLNQIQVTRRGRNNYFEAETRYVRRLHATEDDGKFAHRIHQVFLRHRIPVPGIGGMAGLNLQGLSYQRNSISSGSPGDVDRLSAELDWNRRMILSNGTAFSLTTVIAADRYSIDRETIHSDEEELVPRETRVTGAVAAEFSYPLILHRERSHDLVEPFVQLVWSPKYSEKVPEADSVFVEFDETSLRSLDRISGRDRVEQGLRVNAGMKYTRVVEDSYQMELVFGKTFHRRDLEQFSEESGLSGRRSDNVAAADLQLVSGFGLSQSLVFDDSFDIHKSTSAMSYENDEIALGLIYSRLEKDAAEGMDEDIDSVLANLEFALEQNWKLISDLKLDRKTKGENAVGLGLGYIRDCLDFSAGVERKLSGQGNSGDRTKLYLNFELGGLSGAGRSEPAACSG
ncbi:MAG: LPS assembly protein LptD [Rhodobacteraceae bacterium]|nr:LPS assembly protein LptD [Paracoccaceae bacterium]